MRPIEHPKGLRDMRRFKDDLNAAGISARIEYHRQHAQKLRETGRWDFRLIARFHERVARSYERMGD